MKLLDFGLAKHFPASAGDGRPPTTSPASAPSPARFTTWHPSSWRVATVDYRCDLFALASVLYQMATGARPFDILPRSALSPAIQFQPQMPIRQLAPHHPVQLERIIDCCSRKHPDRPLPVGRYRCVPSSTRCAGA